MKFVLIDPKRLELPFYEGMPHLYDPRGGPDEAQVITQPKEAAKALARLVKVMEHRYDVFARATKATRLNARGGELTAVRSWWPFR